MTKPYAAPTVTSLGSVEELTAGSTTITKQGSMTDTVLGIPLLGDPKTLKIVQTPGG